MKNKKLLTSAAVAALCLPVAGFAQNSNSTSNNATANPYSTQSQRPADQQSSSSVQGPQARDQQTTVRSQQQQRTDSMTTRQTQSARPELQTSSTTIAKIKKVKEDSIENKMTAERLIGKTVVDRDGEEIGEVKDIGLSAVLPASFDRSHSAMHQSSTPMPRRGVGSDTAATQQRDPARSSTSSTSSGSSPSVAGVDNSSRMTSSSMMNREIHVYISTDDDMLLQVPLSELTFNERDDELRLNLAQSQLESIRAESTVASFE